MNNKTPPLKKPKKAINQAHIFKFSAISILGESKDQNEAAIITPAAKPNMESKMVLLTFLKAKTIVAPRAVIPQVNKVAIKACIVGFKLIKNSTIYLPTLVLYETILI